MDLQTPTLSCWQERRAELPALLIESQIEAERPRQQAFD